MTAFMRAPDAGNNRARTWIAFGGLLAAGAVIALRLVFLQVVAHEDLVARADRQAHRIEKIPGPRGEIVDRRGQVLAISVPTKVLFVEPREISREGLLAIEKAVGLSRGKLVRKSDDPWETASRRCGIECEERVQELIENGLVPATAVHWESGYVRSYPHRELASHVLGFVSSAGKGAEGIESRYDNLLRSSGERLLLLRDAKQGVVSNVGRTVSEPSRLMLTLDLRLQATLEEQIERARVQHGARAAQGIVLAADTGEVLAMASYPTFDPNRFGRARARALRNSVVEHAQEPGSVIKPLTAAALLESGAVDESQIVYCENGRWRTHRRVVRDFHPHGWLALPKIIEVSSNIGIAKLAQQMKDDDQFATLRALGLGRRTGIELPAESPGKLKPPDKWLPLDKEAMAYGHGLSASTLQLAAAYAALANDGVYVEPRIVRAWGSPDGRWHRPAAAAKRRAISRATAGRIVDWMENVISGPDGTGSSAAVAGYRIAGKTGTAEKLIDGKYSRDHNFATFAGFGPIDDPAVVVVISLDEPSRSGRTAGVAAAPAFSEVMAESLRLLQVAPMTGKALNARGDESSALAGGRG